MVQKDQNDFPSEKDTVIKLTTATNDSQNQKNEDLGVETNSISEKQETIIDEGQMAQNISEEEPSIVSGNKEIVDKTKNQANEKKLVKTEVNTNEVLKGSIIASVTSGKAPLDVMFDVEGENIVSYLWDFGDNSSTSSDASILHTFSEPGEYRVNLIVLDKNATPKTIIKTITVEKNIISGIGVIQNGFSPNNDGNNDVFIIKTAENIKTFHATIKTLKGEVVYEWNSIREGWDGRDKSGRIMEQGRYILTISAKGIDEVEHPRTEVITLTK